MKEKKPFAAAFLSVLLLATSLQLIGLGNANPYHHEYVYDGELSPPVNVELPRISVLSPKNDALYSSGNISLTFNVSTGGASNPPLSPFILEVSYKADWQPDAVCLYKFIPSKYPYHPSDFNWTSYPTIPEFSNDFNMTGIPEGNHSITVTAVEWRAIDIHENGTAGNVLSYVYRYKSCNIVGSTSIYFTVDNQQPFPFFVVTAFASVAIAGAGLIVYFKKRMR